MILLQLSSVGVMFSVVIRELFSHFDLWRTSQRLDNHPYTDSAVEYFDARIDVNFNKYILK